MALKRNVNALQKRMLKEILRRFPARGWTTSATPFETLVETILSQNTNDSNRDRAMKRLKNRFEISPQVLAETPVRRLAESIRPAGLYRIKATRIKKVSKIILEDFEGDLASILEKPIAESRSVLLDLPGVGPKTADVLLAFVADQPTIPVDTHVMRICKRLGIASKSAGYEETRLAIEKMVPKQHRVAMHLSLIRFGREICKAPKPLCQVCALSTSCPSSRARSQSTNWCSR